ncbi:hypothetical protein EMCG_00291 [[Emmonsia] crescens]|uniref:Uncharacterized protein n=1 Tax=[Emmonsia] crescens TaxID=73230 RepID=A0A0G2HYV4_9EURO|nr:hypothetical protein EMCG_00291 [Emmonsia crescens UAMH 3008]
MAVNSSYTLLISPSPGVDYHPKYILTQRNTWGITGNLKTFQQGALAYRNAQD